MDNANSRRSEFSDREKEMSELDAAISSHKQRLELLALEHSQSSADRRDAVEAKAEVECIVRDAEEAGRKSPSYSLSPCSPLTFH